MVKRAALGAVRGCISNIALDSIEQTAFYESSNLSSSATSFGVKHMRLNGIVLYAKK